MACSQQYENALSKYGEPSAYLFDNQKQMITFTYQFKEVYAAKRTYLNLGMIKYSINTSLNGVKFLNDPLVVDSAHKHHAGVFYHEHCSYVKYPKMWSAKYYEDLSERALFFARKCYRKNMLYYEMIIGYLYYQVKDKYYLGKQVKVKYSNPVTYTRDRNIKFKQLEKIAKWVMWAVKKNISDGDLDLKTKEEVTAAGIKANKLSISSRQSKKEKRQNSVRKLLEDKLSVKQIADELNTNVRTIQRDIKDIEIVNACRIGSADRTVEQVDHVYQVVNVASQQTSSTA